MEHQHKSDKGYQHYPFPIDFSTILAPNEIPKRFLRVYITRYYKNGYFDDTIDEPFLPFTYSKRYKKYNWIFWIKKVEIPISFIFDYGSYCEKKELSIFPIHVSIMKKTVRSSVGSAPSKSVVF